MSKRPLVFVTGLTVGDYLLWNWSLNGNHEVIALVAGLTLPPLALLTLWLAAVAVGRLIARSAFRPRSVAQPVRSRGARASGRRAGGVAVDEKSAPGAPVESSRKIAA